MLEFHFCMRIFSFILLFFICVSKVLSISKQYSKSQHIYFGALVLVLVTNWLPIGHPIEIISSDRKTIEWLNFINRKLYSTETLCAVTICIVCGVIIMSWLVLSAISISIRVRNWLLFRIDGDEERGMKVQISVISFIWWLLKWIHSTNESDSRSHMHDANTSIVPFLISYGSFACIDIRF